MDKSPPAKVPPDARGVVAPHSSDIAHARLRRSVSQRVVESPVYYSLETGVVVMVLLAKTVVVPLILIAVFTTTRYLGSTTLFRLPSESSTLFTSNDTDTTRVCRGCLASCGQVVLDLSKFGAQALQSELAFSSIMEETLAGLAQPASVMALGLELTAAGAICGASGEADESTQRLLFIEASPALVLRVVEELNLSLAFNMVEEIRAAANNEKSGNASSLCSGARWGILAHTKLLGFLPSLHTNIYSSVSASDLTIFTDSPECRKDRGFDSSKPMQLAHDTSGTDLAASMTTVMLLFPHDFVAAAVPQASRLAATIRSSGATQYAVQPFIRGYYGGCIVRSVNTTGVYVDSDCAVDSQWVDYGLVHQYPDDIPMCSTSGICVHTYYNPQQDLSITSRVVDGSADDLTLSRKSFSFRYADTFDLSILPGLVVVQIIVMGILAFYQVMFQKRSVLLTQIWAYRCQSGLAQIVYLMQISYHMYLLSDLYSIALITGTASLETIVNLTCCAYAFSYSFVNILKARIGEQQLHRAFRLTWEILPLAFSGALGYSLSANRTQRMRFLMDLTGEPLARMTSARGLQLCKATETCVVFKGNLVLLMIALALGLWLVAEVVASGFRLVNSPSAAEEPEGEFVRLKSSVVQNVRRLLRTSASVHAETQLEPPNVDAPLLTTFEQHCLSHPFQRLFKDCDDISDIKIRSASEAATRYSTVEAVALSGFVFNAGYLYRADDTPLLLIARVMPVRMLRTFNFLLVRWRIDLERATVAKPTVCHWSVMNLDSKVKTRAMPLA